MKNFFGVSVFAVASLAGIVQAQGRFQAEAHQRRGLSELDILGALEGLESGQRANGAVGAQNGVQQGGKNQAQGAVSGALAVAGVAGNGVGKGQQAQVKATTKTLTAAAGPVGNGAKKGQQTQAQAPAHTQAQAQAPAHGQAQAQPAGIRILTLGRPVGNVGITAGAVGKAPTISEIENIAGIGGGAGNAAVHISFLTVFAGGVAPAITIAPPQQAATQPIVTTAAAAAATPPAPQNAAGASITGGAAGASVVSVPAATAASVALANASKPLATAAAVSAAPIAAAIPLNTTSQVTAAAGPAIAAAAPSVLPPSVGSSGGLAQGTGTANPNGQCDCSCLCGSGSFPSSINSSPLVNAASTLQTLASAPNQLGAAVTVSTNVLQSSAPIVAPGVSASAAPSAVISGPIAGSAAAASTPTALAQSIIAGSSTSASSAPLALAQSEVAGSSAGASPQFSLTTGAAIATPPTGSPTSDPINIATFKLASSLDLGNLAMPTISV